MSDEEARPEGLPQQPTVGEDALDRLPPTLLRALQGTPEAPASNLQRASLFQIFRDDAKASLQQITRSATPLRGEEDGDVELATRPSVFELFGSEEGTADAEPTADASGDTVAGATEGAEEVAFVHEDATPSTSEGAAHPFAESGGWGIPRGDGHGRTFGAAPRPAELRPPDAGPEKGRFRRSFNESLEAGERRQVLRSPLFDGSSLFQVPTAPEHDAWSAAPYDLDDGTKDVDAEYPDYHEEIAAATTPRTPRSPLSPRSPRLDDGSDVDVWDSGEEEVIIHGSAARDEESGGEDVVDVDGYGLEERYSDLFNGGTAHGSWTPMPQRPIPRDVEEGGGGTEALAASPQHLAVPRGRDETPVFSDLYAGADRSRSPSPSPDGPRGRRPSVFDVFPQEEVAQSPKPKLDIRRKSLFDLFGDKGSEGVSEDEATSKRVDRRKSLFELFPDSDVSLDKQDRSDGAAQSDVSSHGIGLDTLNTYSVDLEANTRPHSLGADGSESGKVYGTDEEAGKGRRKRAGARSDARIVRKKKKKAEAGLSYEHTVLGSFHPELAKAGRQLATQIRLEGLKQQMKRQDAPTLEHCNELYYDRVGVSLKQLLEDKKHRNKLIAERTKKSGHRRQQSRSSSMSVTGSSGDFSASVDRKKGPIYKTALGRFGEIALRGQRSVLLLLTVAAIVAASVSVGMDFAILELAKAHVYVSLLGQYFAVQYFIWVAYLFALFGFAAVFTYYMSLNAVGSGIPEMKAVLSGSEIKYYLSVRTLISKIVGLMFASGAGLFIGKEGPFIHMSSIIVHQLMHFSIFTHIRQVRCSPITLFSFLFRLHPVPHSHGTYYVLSALLCSCCSLLCYLTYLQNRGLYQQLLSAACAIGVAGSFGSPIGGLLFSVEVTSTYYPVRNYFWAAYAALISGMTYRIIWNARWGRGLFEAVLPTEFSSLSTLGVVDSLGAVIVLGIAGGVIGAFFTELLMFSIACRRAGAKRWWIFRRYGILAGTASSVPYSALIALVTGLLTFPLLLGGYMGLPGLEALRSLWVQGSLSAAQQWTAPMPLFASLTTFVLARVLFASRLFLPSSCARTFCWVLLYRPYYRLLRLMITTSSLSLPIPCGLFVPSLVIGAGIGRFFGEIVILAVPSLPNHIPAIWAVVGASALSAGVTHTFSTGVVLMEMTGQIRLIAPILLGTILAILISDYLSISVYDALAMMRKLPYLQDLKMGTYDMVAGDIMRTHLPIVYPVDHAKRLCMLLTKFEDQEFFPVVQDEDTLAPVGIAFRYEIEDLVVAHLDTVQRVRELNQLTHHGPVDQLLRTEDPKAQTSIGFGGTFKRGHKRARSDGFNWTAAKTALEVLDETEEVSDKLEMLFWPSPVTLDIDTTIARYTENTVQMHLFFITLQLDVAWVVHDRRFVGLVTRSDLLTAIKPKVVKRMERALIL